MQHTWHLSREQVRAIDRFAAEELGIPILVLMENAGRGCADLLVQAGVAGNGPVCICCGRGNNGGDGFVIARHLEVLEIPTEVFLFDDRSAFQGPALANLKVLDKIDVPVHELRLPGDLDQLHKHLARASWIVDALLGSGSQGELRDPYAAAVEVMNAAGAPILAVDMPSGLDCDTGTPGPVCIRAKLTGSFLAVKPGFANPAAAEFLGEVHVLPIGIPRTVISRFHGCEENLLTP